MGITGRKSYKELQILNIVKLIIYSYYLIWITRSCIVSVLEDGLIVEFKSIVLVNYSSITLLEIRCDEKKETSKVVGLHWSNAS